MSLENLPAGIPVLRFLCGNCGAAIGQTMVDQLLSEISQSTLLRARLSEALQARGPAAAELAVIDAAIHWVIDRGEGETVDANAPDFLIEAVRHLLARRTETDGSEPEAGR